MSFKNYTLETISGNLYFGFWLILRFDTWHRQIIIFLWIQYGTKSSVLNIWWFGLNCPIYTDSQSNQVTVSTCVELEMVMSKQISGVPLSWLNLEFPPIIIIRVAPTFESRVVVLARGKALLWSTILPPPLDLPVAITLLKFLFMQCVLWNWPIYSLADQITTYLSWNF